MSKKTPMHSKNADQKFSDSAKVKLEIRKSDELQCHNPKESKIEESLIAAWKKNFTGVYVMPPIRKIMAVRSVLEKHQFQEHIIDQHTVSLCVIVNTRLKEIRKIERPAKINNADIAKFQKILGEARSALDNPPIVVAVRSSETSTQRTIPAKTIRRVSWKNGELILTDIYGPWKSLIEKAKADLEEIIKYTSLHLSKKQKPNVGGRPNKLKAITEVIKILCDIWSTGTGKRPNLSRKLLSFNHFLLDVCSCPPLRYTNSEINSALRKIVTKNKSKII